MLIRKPLSPWRLSVCLLVAVALTFLTLYSLGSAFRDNDQAALISGAIQLIRGQMPPLHAAFYNYDKQWGSYFLLTVCSVVWPHADPVLRGNALQVALLLPTMLAAIFVIYLKTRAPVWTFLPLFVSPALVLYMPFLATASLSLAFLFLSFVLLRTGWRWSALAAIAAAAACRGDVILVGPIIVLSNMPRKSFVGMVRSRFAWLVGVAAVGPVLVGKLISGIRFSDVAGFWFNFELFTGFVTFALGIGVGVLLLIVCSSRLRLVVAQSRWRLFYLLELLALLIPIAFYWSQLYSPRYFFLTLIALLIMATSRRTTVLLSPAPLVFSVGVLAFTVLPWVIGFSIPTFPQTRFTWSQPTTFPTADGAFPMGAYASFQILAAGQDHLNIDHNQKTWESVRTIDFQTCTGMVPVMATPMSYYFDVAIRLQGKTPERVVNLADARCGGAYADLRAMIRHDSPGMEMARSNLSIVSTRPELGRPIVWITKHQEPSRLTQALRELPKYFGGKDAEVFIGKTFPVTHELPVVYFSNNGDCKSRIAGTLHLCGNPEPTEDGWARAVFPGYINK